MTKNDTDGIGQIEIVRNQRGEGFWFTLGWDRHDRVKALFDEYGLMNCLSTSDVVIERLGYTVSDGYRWRIALSAEHQDSVAFAERFNAAAGMRAIEIGSGRLERRVEFTCAALPAIRKALHEWLRRRLYYDGPIITANGFGCQPGGESDGRHLWCVHIKEEFADDCLEQLAATVSATVSDVAARLVKEAGGMAIQAIRDDEPVSGDDQAFEQALVEAWEARCNGA